MAENTKDEQELVSRLRQPQTARSAFNEVIRRYSEPL